VISGFPGLCPESSAQDGFYTMDHTALILSDGSAATLSRRSTSSDPEEAAAALKRYPEGRACRVPQTAFASPADGL